MSNSLRNDETANDGRFVVRHTRANAHILGLSFDMRA